MPSIISTMISDVMTTLDPQVSPALHLYSSARADFEAIGVTSVGQLATGLSGMDPSLQFVGLVLLARCKRRVTDSVVWTLMHSADEWVRGAAVHLASRHHRPVLIRRSVRQLQEETYQEIRHQLVWFLAHSPFSSQSPGVVKALYAQCDNHRNTMLCRAKAMEGVVLHVKQMRSGRPRREVHTFLSRYADQMEPTMRETALWGLQYIEE